ncbi:hypothetical protein [Burkholderia oklahomensis]|uniref:hypothetical protein n=1 Tax=Burkholderia oklahomensis TaxID=342113 RepID=UPI00265ACC50|nr:hypothetical protein [Burkholderia oklahomensis]
MGNRLGVHIVLALVLSDDWCAALADDCSATGVPFCWTIFSVRAMTSRKPFSEKGLREAGRCPKRGGRYARRPSFYAFVT